jgi:type II secretion system protein N
VYALGILVVLLWFLFPREAVQRLLLASASSMVPELHWRVQTVTLQWPLQLQVEHLAGYSASDEQRPQVRVDTCTVQPEWMSSLKTRRLQVGYSLGVGKGGVSGMMHFGGQPLRVTAVRGTAHDLQLADCPLLARRLGRKIDGLLSGTFAGGDGRVNARIKVAQGSVGLKRPVLAHTELPFADMTMMLQGDGTQWQLEQGAVESPLFTGQFTGTLTLAGKASPPWIDLKGNVRPTASFFHGLPESVALQAVRVRLKDSPLPFRISGDVAQPGLHFEEFAILFQTLEKELH